MKRFPAALFASCIAVGAYAQFSKHASDFSDVQKDFSGKAFMARLNGSKTIVESNLTQYVSSLAGTGLTAVQEKRETDQLGFTRVQFRLEKDGEPLAQKRIYAHLREGKLEVLNGDLDLRFASAGSFNISEESALASALQKIGAESYKWQNKADEQMMKEKLNDPSFTYYPHGAKTWFEHRGEFRAAWVFKIYAEQPLSKANVFVDAGTGEVIEEQNLLCTVNTPGTANTKYSGTQTIVCDNTGSTFRLRETTRGLGIETYDMNNQTNYGSTAVTDFTNTSAAFNYINVDRGALDAHWGAEKTYDYYFYNHNRNSINNAGYKLLQYVHYGTNYTNAMWDGTRMTYGDGGSGMGIFTALDICGHEITHGLTDFTSNLIYSYESGALNESFSDIFGACVENYARPSNWNWKIAEDLYSNGQGFRNMANPQQFGDPDCYKGNGWATGTADNGGVHTNSGVSNFWFYLLTQGGTGVNDNSDAYNVSGLGFAKSSKIAFRALTVYFTPSTNYAAARVSCIQAAKDLYGDCSNEMIQTANAWYAVGVGPQLSATSVNPNFNAPVAQFCSLPAQVFFNNTTPYAYSFQWDFGDGSTSTFQHPSHTYTAAGSYVVKLKANGCMGFDSVSKSAFVTINLPSSPITQNAATCSDKSVTLSANANASLLWYDSPTNSVSINAGPTLTIDTLKNTTTYYVTNSFTFGPQFGGIAVTSGGGYITNPNNWLVFDVLQDCRLNSVYINAQTAGTRTIELRAPGSIVMDTKTVNLNVGGNTVMLDFFLPAGIDYELGLELNSYASIYRTNTAVNYPYNVSNLVSIKSSNAGTGSYYWFYNWSVSQASCVSPMVAVTASAIPSPVVVLTAPNHTVCLADEIPLNIDPLGGTLSGNGTTSNNYFSAAGLGVGQYSLNYIYTDPMTGCGGSADLVLTATECVGLNKNVSSNLLVYPNPASNELHVSGLPNGAVITLSDVTGRMLKQFTSVDSEATIDLSNVSGGVLIVVVKDQNKAVLASQKVIRTN